MFGYVKIYKDELKVKDYNLFKSYYCGLCQTLKKEYGFPARYFLSYDITFLAVLFAAVCEEQIEVLPIRCLANPAVRRPAAKRNAILTYAAAVNVLLVWFKLKDDWQDNRSFKAMILMPFMAGKKNKAKKQYPALYQTIEQALGELSALEQSGCAALDAPANAFGKLMTGIFSANFIVLEETQRILAHCGGLLGRFIYLLDAWADRAEDAKKKTYNPFLLAKEIEVETIKTSLEYTLSQLANSVKLLVFEKNQDLIENIIYLGLRKALEDVFADKEHAASGGVKEKRHERPI